jgi:hypothetical protein
MYNNRQFEPFGEPVTLREAGARPLSVRRARFVNLGVGAFWGLVILVVAARAVYFDPNVVKSFVVAAVDGLWRLVTF